MANISKSRKPRISEIDILRGAAFLAVVLQHSIAHYFPLPVTGLGDGVLMGLLLIASKFAVPLFVFMTGMSLFYSYDGEVPYLTFMRKRLKDIALPYLPWALLYAAEFQHVQLLDSSGWQKLGLMLFTGKASYHLWYIVMVFQLYFPAITAAGEAAASSIVCSDVRNCCTVVRPVSPSDGAGRGALPGCGVMGCASAYRVFCQISRS